jgi:hypothetical protein
LKRPGRDAAGITKDPRADVRSKDRASISPATVRASTATATTGCLPVDDVMNVLASHSTIEVGPRSSTTGRREAAVLTRTRRPASEAAYVTLKSSATPSVERAELRDHVERRRAIAKPANIVFTPELSKHERQIMRRR